MFIPAFVYGVASLWAVPFLFLFVHLVRVLCQVSWRRYETNPSYTNEGPKIKGIVFELCTCLSLPFIAYIYIIGDLNASVSSGLDRALILSLPLEVIKLPIDGDPSVFQMLLVFQLLVSLFGWGGGMLYARKEISTMSLPKLPHNISVNEDSTQEEWKQHNSLWGKYYYDSGMAALPVIVTIPIIVSFFRKFWADSDIHVLEYVLILPSMFFLPYVIFSVFFAIAYNCISFSRMS